MNKRKKRSLIWKIQDDVFAKIIKDAKTFKEILVHFGLESKGGNNETIKRRCAEQGIDLSHIKMGRSHRKGQKYLDFGLSKENALTVIFIKDSESSRNTVKRYVNKYSLIPYKCACGNEGLWESKPLSLQLDHINGEPKDHRLENLRWLCPNCHSQTETFTGKHKKRKPRKIKVSALNPNWRHEPRTNQRKVARPSKEELELLVKEHPMTTLGKMFGVSDNAVRKWCSTYGIDIKSIAHWCRRSKHSTL